MSSLPNVQNISNTPSLYDIALTVLNSVTDAVIMTNAQGQVIYMNLAAQQITAWRLQDALGRPIFNIAPLYDELNAQPVSLLEYLSPATATLATQDNKPARREAILSRRDRMRINVAYYISHLSKIVRDYGEFGLLIRLEDISHQRLAARRNTWQTNHDQLTGLASRHAFEIRMAELVNSAKSEQREHALLYLDLDQFKVINDTCGHAAGDSLLCEVAKVLQQELEPESILARLGGDEFGVLLPNCGFISARTLAQALRDRIHRYRFNWQNKTFSLGISIGLVKIDSAAEDVSSLLSRADAACFSAKDAGRNRVHTCEYENSAVDRHRGEMLWVSRLQLALDKGDLLVYGQTIQSFSSVVPNRIEILVRLLDQTNIIAPNEFLGPAERYNLMSSVDRWVITHTLSILRGWEERDRPFININLSGTSLSDEHFSDFLVDCVLHSEINPRQICFEITETAAIRDLGYATAFMHKLRNIGCEFALDDFGAGLSSFAYIKNLPIDYLKIDGSIVRNADTDKVDFVMLESIHRIGKTIGIKTVAEYAETDSILNTLRTIGLDYAQGYAIDKPQPFKTFNSKKE